jgi:predicted alpha/beta-hydrolase family hydrolase
MKRVERHGLLVVGGRSAGARVACRTAVETGAAAVLCLAFPLHPPGRPERSRAPELAGAGRPVVVVQGVRDVFGTPADLEALGLPGVEIVEAASDHGLAPRTRSGRDELAGVVTLAVRRAFALAASRG